MASPGPEALQTHCKPEPLLAVVSAPPIMDVL